ncbi:hypothetical protein Ppa06_09180 [Planomonospora parontospora subsp. parontospora]|uniref:Outer membrane channel protein CpnT-like N-terminal domain-containing protein n=2 Tax=Planomonospora parontospora TaxID=58119 RepID=A0AA37F2K4_9ACTN|nr:hypothetical protein [Planomonospora parontospora]GGK50430.1 hypothetical protein GCM10010126_07430 [Planomonospora parontospora]GII07120.1 hypothetical protein Ppa06_09180 [Planomonospora parontospora subsp. parontospora]
MGFDGFLVPDWAKPWVGWVVGTDWPEGDESACFRLADACAAAALKVASGGPLGSGAPVRPGDDWDGEALKAFADHVRRVSGGRQADLVDRLVAAALEFNRVGVQVEYTKRMIEVSVWFLILQIAWLLAAAAGPWGAVSLTLVGARAQIARMTVRQIARRLLLNIGLFGGLMAGLDLGVQASQSRRDSIDWDQVLASAGTGALTGAFLTGLSGGLSRLATGGLQAGLTRAEMSALEKLLAASSRSMWGLMGQSALANGAATAVSLGLSGDFDWETVLKGTTAGALGGADAHWAGASPSWRSGDHGGPGDLGGPGGPGGSRGSDASGDTGGSGGPGARDGGGSGGSGGSGARDGGSPGSSGGSGARDGGGSGGSGVPEGAGSATRLAQAAPDGGAVPGAGRPGDGTGYGGAGHAGEGRSGAGHGGQDGTAPRSAVDRLLNWGDRSADGPGRETAGGRDAAGAREAAGARDAAGAREAAGVRDAVVGDPGGDPGGGQGRAGDAQFSPEQLRELADAQAEAERILADRFGDEAPVVDYTSTPMHPDIAREYNRALVRLADGFPEVMAGLGEISTRDPLGRFEGGVGGGYSVLRGPDQGIYLNAGMLDDPRRVTELYADRMRVGWLSRGYEDLGAVLYHEFGHHLLQDLPYSAERQLAQAFREVTGRRLAVDMPFHPDTAAEVGRALSRYGAADPHEMVAEAFAEYMGAGMPRPLAIALGVVLRAHHLPGGADG